MRILSTFYVTYALKNNIYTVIYREMGTFLPILTPGLAPYAPEAR